jgi:hypothetical protein
MAAPVFSITRAEIEEFWRRKEVEEEDRRLAAEKEAARTKAKALKVSQSVFLQLVDCIFGYPSAYIRSRFQHG